MAWRGREGQGLLKVKMVHVTRRESGSTGWLQMGPYVLHRLCDWPWSPDLSSSLMECPLKNSDKRDLNSIDLMDLRPLTFKNETSWSEKSACSVWKANLPGLSCGHLEV